MLCRKSVSKIANETKLIVLLKHTFCVCTKFIDYLQDIMAEFNDYMFLRFAHFVQFHFDICEKMLAYRKSTKATICVPSRYEKKNKY